MRGSWTQGNSRRPIDRLARPFRDWLDRFSSVTHLLLWLNVAVFLVQLLFDFLRSPLFNDLFALSGDGLRHFYLWQPVSYMFLHSGLLHILFNMLILWFIGREVEYFIGGKFYTRLYLLGGLFGAALWLAFNANSGGSVMGASAAVLACVIAFATLFPEREITLLVFFVIPVRLKAKYLAWCLVALDAVPVLQHAQSNVAHLAHLGGAALGYLYIKQLGYGQTPRWMLWWQSLGEKLKPRRPAPVRKRERDLTPEEFMRDKVDPILDKIARDGMQSLTREERQVLESAKEHLRKRTT